MLATQCHFFQNMQRRLWIRRLAVGGTGHNKVTFCFDQFFISQSASCWSHLKHRSNCYATFCLLVPLLFVPSPLPLFTDHHTIFPLFIPAMCPIPLLFTSLDPVMMSNRGNSCSSSSKWSQLYSYSVDTKGLNSIYN